jgi:hypothetical protein
MRRLVCLLVVALFGLSAIGANGCNPWALDDPTSPPATCPGVGGDGAGGGAGGDDGAGGTPDDGAGGGSTEVSAGAGAASSSTDASAGAGAGPSCSDVSAGAGAGPGVRPVHHPGGPRRRGGLGTAAEAFCPGLPPMMTSMPRLYPFTTLDLRAVAAAQNIGQGMTGVQFNRAVGLAFEDWVLTTMGQLPRNTTPLISAARQLKNASRGGLPKSVIPEYVDSLSLVVNFKPVGTWPWSQFFEVKAVTGALTLSTSQWQILGLIDVAAKSPVTTATNTYAPPPELMFTTTANTTIAQSVIDYASSRGVAIWQRMVFSDFTPPNNPDLYLGDANPLNPQLYGNAALPTFSGFPPSKLTSPTTPPSSLLVPGDPDPPDVD